MTTMSNLQKFCSTDKCRPTIHKPFLRDGYTWAITGRILLRTAPVEGLLENPNAPDVTTVFEKNFVDVPMRRLKTENSFTRGGSSW